MAHFLRNSLTMRRTDSLGCFNNKKPVEHIKYTIQQRKTPGPVKTEGFSRGKKLTKGTMIEGFSKIPNVIIQDPGLTCQDFRVLSVLIFHSFYKNWCNPSHGTIAREANISTTAVKRGLRKAKKLGYIVWKRTGSSNRYILVWKVKKPRSKTTH